MLRRKVFPVKFQFDYFPKMCLKRSILLRLNIKIISRMPAANGAIEIVDNSRLSTEANAPLFQLRMTDTCIDSWSYLCPKIGVNQRCL